MSPPLPIPAKFQTLVECLQGAIHSAPAGPSLRHADWTSLLRQAQEHGVAAYLYPWLATQLPDLFSSRAAPAEDAAPPVWRALFLTALSQSALRQKQLADLLDAFGRKKIAVIPLKGAWLCENVYDDPAQRSMSDLDLLVRKEDCEACHRLFTEQGYTTRQTAFRNPYCRDQPYARAGAPLPVELHWDFSSEMSGLVPAPDLPALWTSTVQSTCCGRPARQFALEDCLTHLAHHMINHTFALPLRAHLDIALLVMKFGPSLSPERLEAAGRRWGTGFCVPFLLGYASALFAFPLPPGLEAYSQKADPSRLAQATRTFFELPQARERDGETTLLQFKNASPAGRLLLIMRRILMPRPFLALRYPCARHRLGMPLAWLLRARDLYREKEPQMKAILHSSASRSQLLEDVQTREALVRWLLAKTDKPA